MCWQDSLHLTEVKSNFFFLLALCGYKYDNSMVDSPLSMSNTVGSKYVFHLMVINLE